MIKVGVTTGIYYAARDEEMSSPVRKIGYILTRGVDVAEIASDVPHEIDYTDGKEIRHIAKKQGVNLTLHGSLTVPMTIPERGDWRDAQEHINRSVRSAVFAGCKYVLFHLCLHFWLEMITYVSSKLTIEMADFYGRHIWEILFEDKKTRKWFIKRMRDLSEIYYPHYILDEDEKSEIASRLSTLQDRWTNDMLREKRKAAGLPGPDVPAVMLPPEQRKKAMEIDKEVAEEVSKRVRDAEKKVLDEFVEKKLSNPDPKKRRWRVSQGRYWDAYMIIAHYLFFRKDPVWVEMAKMYKPLLERYKIDYNDEMWLDKAWRKADEKNDREFKEFFYAVVAAKFIEGHMKHALEFINGKLMNEIEKTSDKELMNVAKNLKITLEIPDAREPKYSGLYMIWRPKQQYAAVKAIRKILKTDKIFMTLDFEHIATHGVDPIIEMEETIKLAPDFGRYVLSVHSNSPNPLHAHYPVELGDIKLYKLLWMLRKTGMGKGEHDVYLLFERGGGQDPFKQSVDALKIMAKFLEKDTPPEKLPLEFYGLEKTAGDVERQLAIIKQHRLEPLKDLLEVPEEEWGLLSSAAVRKGKTKEWQKEETK